MGRQQLLVRMTRILTPPIRMMHQPGCGLPPPQRHPQRLLHQGRIDMRTHRPPHDFARIQVQQHRHIQPALCRPHIGDIPDPHLIGLLHIKLPGQQIRRHPIAMPTVGRHRVTLAADAGP